MMGHRQVEQAALFYEFSLDKHIPADHLLHSIDRFVELGDVRQELTPFCSSTGRLSVDPELMIRMLATEPAELVHRAEDSADSLPRANRIRFAT